MANALDQDRTSSTAAAVERFNVAFNAHDVDAVMAAMTEDCIFESTSPPGGWRYEGQEAVRACWEEFFQGNPSAQFEAEEVVVAGDRCVVRWLYRWTDGAGQPESVRGIDLLRVRDGKVAEKLAYVKG